MESINIQDIIERNENYLVDLAVLNRKYLRETATYEEIEKLMENAKLDFYTAIDNYDAYSYDYDLEDMQKVLECLSELPIYSREELEKITELVMVHMPVIAKCKNCWNLELLSGPETDRLCKALYKYIQDHPGECQEAIANMFALNYLDYGGNNVEIAVWFPKLYRYIDTYGLQENFLDALTSEQGYLLGRNLAIAKVSFMRVINIMCRFASVADK
jgi:hypothetical protein